MNRAQAKKAILTVLADQFVSIDEVVEAAHSYVPYATGTTSERETEQLTRAAEEVLRELERRIR